VQEKLGPDAVVVTVFSDDNKKYLSTDLMREEHTQENYLSSHIELSALSATRRSCAFCEGYEPGLPKPV
jgi:cysteine synthase